MLFSSLTFLLLFLPAVLLCYFIIPGRMAKNTVLLIFSLLFYAWGEPRTIFIMIFEILLTYIAAILMEKAKKQKAVSVARGILWLTIAVHLLILFYFKYMNFFLQDIMQMKNLVLKITLPIGISFYSFQILSYFIDVYRGKVKAQRNLIYLGTYVTLFPQLIAGPIVRYETVEKELVKRKESFNNLAEGFRRFIIGLGKKIIIANHMAIVADTIFLHVRLSDMTSLLAWLGGIAFMMQIYFDFGGYSDMAIGLGRMFGFHFLENFNYPYMATSVTDFWRRWHISLSTWFRDYVYIPLGGNRVGKVRWVLNLLVVWSLTGLWHGASWNFIFWGFYFGVLLIIERFVSGQILKKLPLLNILITNLFVLIGWIIFNSSSIDQIMTMLRCLFIPSGEWSIKALKNLGLVYLWPYFIIAFVGCFPQCKNIFKRLNKSKLGLFYDLFLFLVLAICILLLINNTYNPFIYFRF